MKKRISILIFFLIMVSVITLAQVEEVKLFPVTENKKCGYIDKTGKIIIPLQFDDLCYDFSEGMASVAVGGKRGFIDVTGRIVIEPQFDLHSASGFSEGLAPISINRKKGYVDKSGKVTMLAEFASIFHSVGSFSEGLATIEYNDFGGPNYQSNSQMGYIDKSFKLVIPMKFKYASDFSDGRAYVRETEETSYYIDRSGQKINYPPAGKWFLFTEGLATTALKDKEGYMNVEGKIVIKPRFDEAKRFSHGFAPVKIKDKWGFIDKTGWVVVRPQFDEVEDFGPDGIAAVVKYDKNLESDYGFVDHRGRMVIGFKFDIAGSFWGGLAEIGTRDAKNNYSWGYINPSGKIVWPPSR